MPRSSLTWPGIPGYKERSQWKVVSLPNAYKTESWSSDDGRKMVWLPQLPQLAETGRGPIRNPEAGRALGVKGGDGVTGSVISSRLGFLRVTKWLQRFRHHFETSPSRVRLEGHLQE